MFSIYQSDTSLPGSSGGSAPQESMRPRPCPNDSGPGELTERGLVLVVETGTQEICSTRLCPGHQMTVGRDPRCDFCIEDDKLMSRWHFSIECCRDHAIVRDMNSRNGTQVNGEQILQTDVGWGSHIVAGATILSVQRVG